MLKFRRDLVEMSKAKNFVASAMAIEKEFTHLSANGPHGHGWIAPHLNARGAGGDASKAAAVDEKWPTTRPAASSLCCVT
jgi:creatinine amidohydrolase